MNRDVGVFSERLAQVGKSLRNACQILASQVMAIRVVTGFKSDADPFPLKYDPSPTTV